MGSRLRMRLVGRRSPLKKLAYDEALFAQL
jgi:hypothetical protein